MYLFSSYLVAHIIVLNSLAIIRQTAANHKKKLLFSITDIPACNSQHNNIFNFFH